MMHDWMCKNVCVSFIFWYFNYFIQNIVSLTVFAFTINSVIRASVPKLNLDDAFEQKNEIAKAVEDELEKVINLFR